MKIYLNFILGNLSIYIRSVRVNGDDATTIMGVPTARGGGRVRGREESLPASARILSVSQNGISMTFISIISSS